MEISKMLHLESMNLEQTDKMYVESRELLEIAASFSESMEKSFERKQVTDIIEAEYDLGDVADVYKIFRGYVNKSYGLCVTQDGVTRQYFVRKYSENITEDEILLEHRLLTHLAENGFDVAAQVVLTKDKKTYVKKTYGEGDGFRERYFAVYAYLPGEDKYAWDETGMTVAEYKSIGNILALFHSAGRDFDPQGLEKIEPKMRVFVPNCPERYRAFLSRNTRDKCHKYLQTVIDRIEEVTKINVILEKDYAKLPQVPCHCNLHGGNMKYADEKVVGMFNFDWTKLDIRLFDICVTLAFVCASWKANTDGYLDLDKCELVLRAYNEKLKEKDVLEPLTDIEKKYFPVVMALANLYLVNWNFDAYYSDIENNNEYEYRGYQRHSIGEMEWIEANKGKLAEMIKRI